MEVRTAIFFNRKQLLDYLSYLDRRIAAKRKESLFDDEYDRCIAMRYQVTEALGENF